MEDQRQAESIEAGKRRKAGSLQQTVEVLQIKELQEQRDSRGQLRLSEWRFLSTETMGASFLRPRGQT